MQPCAALAYVIALLILFLKYFVVTAIQGKARFSTRTFRWPEDARTWNGAPARGPESDLIERAQSCLRNDAETQPFFYAFAAAWVALGAASEAASIALPAYALARCGHAWFFLRPKQPLRNRMFVLAQLLLVGIIVDVVRRALAQL